MPAVVYGTIGWGLTAETGLYAESVEFDTGIDAVWIGGPTGDDVAGATFNSSATFTVTGFTNTSGALGAKTGAAITLANAIAWNTVVGHGYASGGQTIIESVKTGLNVKQAQSRDVSGVFKPFMAAAAV